MKKTRLILFVVFLCAMSAPVADTVAATESFGKDPCCFTNARFTGVCKVAPGDDESCSSILAYLNNQASVGKSYCGNSTVRGGWTVVDCK